MSICAFPVDEQETSMQSLNIFRGVYSMILSTLNFVYDSALQSMKTIYFHYLRHPVSLFMFFVFSKSILISQCRLNLIFSLLLGLFPVWNHYSKNRHMTWATKRSLIPYDETKDRIRKE